MIGKYKELRYCKILKGTKKPFEKDWTNKPYTWEEIQDHIKKETNFGVLCGHGNLAVIDSDNVLLQKHIERFLPKTYKVKTGGGGTHNYFFIPELKNKIILYDKETHLGEVQSYGTQVVGAGSIHPNKNKYLEEDNKIIEIKLEDLLDVINPFMNEIKTSEENAVWERQNDSEIDNLDVANIWGTSGLKYKNGEYYGSHPIHSSETGMNFWINPSKNLWHCFRCNSGGSVLSAIAVKEGIIDCKDAHPGYLRGDRAKQTIEIAKEKYGLKDNLLKKPISNYDVVKESDRTDFELIWEKDLDKFENNKNWIIDKLIPEKSVGIWTGKRSTYKTFLVLNAVFCVASGIKFMEMETKKGSVIYLDKENGIHTMKIRKNMVKNGLGIEDNVDVGFICFSTLKIDKLRDIKKIEELIIKHKPSLLVVDTYRRGISFEENDAGAVSGLFVDILRPLVEKHDFSIVLIHHDRKGQGQGDEMDEIRGSSDLANYTDFILKNERRGKRIILKQLKSRSAPEIKPIEIFVETDEEEYISFKYKGEYESQSTDDRGMEELLIWIAEKKIESFKTGEAKEFAFSKGIKKSTFYSIVQKLVGQGIIEKEGFGSYKVLQQRKLSKN